MANYYYEDAKERISGERHAAIVIKENKLLVIHRIKEEYEYCVLPGGNKRKGEKGEDAAVRETKEETNIDCINPQLVFEFRDYTKNNIDYYYLCEWKKGTKPKLTGEEAVRNCKENFYEPMWVALKDIQNLNILPYFAKYWLLENIKKLS